MASGSSSASRLVVAGLLVASVALAVAPAVRDYRTWQADRARYFAGEVVPSNPDSYYYLRAAREVYTGEWVPKERDRLRHHPDGAMRGDAPWLSAAIANLTHWTDGDVYEAGLWFAVATSSLFVVPAVLFGLFVGWPTAGLLAGLVGVASHAVASRTGIHRIEQDGLNLFAFWGICLLVALLRPSIGLARQLALSAMTGLSAAALVGWYAKAGLILVFAAGVGASGLAQRLALRRVALLVGVFLVFCNPLMLGDAARHLFGTAKILSSTVAESQTVETGAETRAAWSPLRFSSFRISERRSLGWERSLRMLMDPPWLAALGVLGFAGWVVFEWRRAAALLPLVALGAMGPFIPRFLMYLAPLVGFGLGVCLTLGARAALGRTRFPAHADALACLLALVAGGMLLTRTDDRARQVVPVDVLGSLQRCGEALPAGSVVWHSWGFGYVVQDVMGAATHTDGGEPNPVIDHLLVKALTGSDAQVLQRTFAYLERTPQRKAVAEFRKGYVGSYERLLSQASGPSSPSYVAFTPESMLQFPAHARRGQWDPETARPGSGNITTLRCWNPQSGRLRCRERGGRWFGVDVMEGSIEADDGSFSSNLSNLYRIVDGSIARVRPYADPSGLVFAILAPARDGAYLAYAMWEDEFESLVNQLYLLGRYDPRYLEPVCDEFPHARVYRVREDSFESPSLPQGARTSTSLVR